MTSTERKAALSQFISSHQPEMTGITITYRGERKRFNAYSVPLEILTYNPYNGRIGAEVKSYERQNHVLDPNNPDDVAIIEEFLWNSKVDANKATLNSLLRNHQEKFGIVTADGMIIDGNRRACLLNRLFHDQKLPLSEREHTQYFLCIVLPEDATKKEILKLETTYQMGEDAKVDYGPIEKYLKAKDLLNEGFSEQEIAEFMGTTKSQVASFLRVMKIMDEYLDFYGYTGIYTMLGDHEDSFIKLESALKGYVGGSVSSMWGYDVESDVSDLKQVAFDYIRFGKMDQTSFREIIRLPKRNNPNSSIFANEEIWRDFSQKHFAIIDSVHEESVEELRAKHPTGDMGRLLRARDARWIESVGEKMEENYSRSLDRLQNKRQASQALALTEKAKSALMSIDTAQEEFHSNPEVKKQLEILSQIIDSLKTETR